MSWNEKMEKLENIIDWLTNADTDSPNYESKYKEALNLQNELSSMLKKERDVIAKTAIDNDISLKEIGLEEYDNEF